MDTYLVIHDCVVNILDQAPEVVRILNVIEEVLNFPLFSKWGQSLTNVLQFPANPRE